MTPDEPQRRPPVVLRAVARVVSWPLSASAFVLGAVLRVLGLLPRALFGRGSPERGVAGGLASLSEFGSQAVGYLLWSSDRVPPLVGRVPALDTSPGPWHEARRRLCRNRVALTSWIGIALYLYVGIGAQAGLVAPGWEKSDPSMVYAAPEGLGEAHVLGTDQIGNDVGALALRGVLTALLIGTIAAFLACLVGTVLGAMAGYFGGWVDGVIVAIYTLFESIPELLLLLSFAYVLRKNPAFVDLYSSSFLKTTFDLSVGLFTIVLAIGLTGWVGVCRTVRGEFVRHRDRDYVTAAKALGVPTGRVLFRHILPNVFHLVLVSFSLLFVTAIKSEVILSFLGIGLDPGEASWGQMIIHAQSELMREPTVWWPIVTATTLMFGLVLSVSLFTDGLRDALDPRLKS